MNRFRNKQGRNTTVKSGAGVWKTDRNPSGRRPEYLTYVASISNQQDSIEMQYEDENIWLTQKKIGRAHV